MRATLKRVLFLSVFACLFLLIGTVAVPALAQQLEEPTLFCPANFTLAETWEGELFAKGKNPQSVTETVNLASPTQAQLVVWSGVGHPEIPGCELGLQDPPNPEPCDDPTQAIEAFYIDVNGSEVAYVPDHGTDQWDDIPNVSLGTLPAGNNTFTFRHAGDNSAPTVESVLYAIGLCTQSAVEPPPTTVTVVKVVVNDNGGTLTVGDFPLFLNQQQVTSGVANTVQPGAYTVSETQQVGYTATFSGDCNANGQLTVAEGQNLTCTITNNDIPPEEPPPTRLTVIKQVINDNGGTAVVSDFPLFVDQQQVASGQTINVQPGAYTVSETQLAGYSASFTGDCDANGQVTIAQGQSLTCTVINNDTPTDEPPTEEPPPDDPDDPDDPPQPALVVGDPAIGKLAEPPFALPGQPVTWVITVSNPSGVTFTNVSVSDDIPAETVVEGVSATAGNVTFSGQNVRFTKDSLAPGETVTIRVQTRVREDAVPPYTINNTATLTVAETARSYSADASVLSVATLPAAGMSPWQAWRPPVFLAVSGLLLAAGVGVWRRRRSLA